MQNFTSSRDVARFHASLSSAERKQSRMEGDLRVYHGSAFPERLMMLIMNMLAPCLICGRFGGMLTAAAVRSVRREKNKERRRERFRKEVVSLFGFVISRNI